MTPLQITLSEREITPKSAPTVTALKGRKRKKSDPLYKGKPIRLSGTVYNIIEQKRQKQKRKPKKNFQQENSWDTFFRRLLNIPFRDGTSPGLIEVWLLPSSGKVFPSEAKARGEAVMLAVRKGLKGKIEKPIRLREVI